MHTMVDKVLYNRIFLWADLISPVCLLNGSTLPSAPLSSTQKDCHAQREKKRERENSQFLMILLNTPLASGFGFPWYNEQINSSDLALNSAYEMNPLSSGMTMDWRVSASSVLSCRFSSGDSKTWGYTENKTVAHLLRQRVTKSVQIYVSLIPNTQSNFNKT